VTLASWTVQVMIPAVPAVQTDCLKKVERIDNKLVISYKVNKLLVVARC
jgi:hypothetical protein